MVAAAHLAIGAGGITSGLHAPVCAYFAGAMMPTRWLSRLPIDRLGIIDLFLFSPLFFGHSALKIEGGALSVFSVLAPFALLVLSGIGKIAAVAISPPDDGLKRREALAIGALLQCEV